MEIAYFDFYYGITEDTNLPQFMGTTIRGGFGNVFKKIVCPFKDKECKECLLATKCVYTYVFETPAPEGSKIMRKYEHVPHPFVIEPPSDNRIKYEKGDNLAFNLLLIGKAIDYLPYFIYSFEMLGDKGLGKKRARLNLNSIMQKKNIVYDGSTGTLKEKIITEKITFNPSERKINSIKITFLTPTRIIHQGVVIKNPEFYKIVPNLLRRISLLAYFHCGEFLDIDFKGLLKMAEKIKTSIEFFAFKNFGRYSGRQKKIIPMDGFIGIVIYEGDLSLFYPYLRAGEILHIGKGTAFGMGKYRMEVLK